MQHFDKEFGILKLKFQNNDSEQSIILELASEFNQVKMSLTKRITYQFLFSDKIMHESESNH